MKHCCPYCGKEYSRSKDIPPHIRSEREKEANQAVHQRSHAEAIIQRPGRKRNAVIPTIQVFYF